MKKAKRVLVFGVFDGLHQGHEHFLVEAAKLGNLYVCLAQDSVVSHIKGFLPQHVEQERESALESLKSVKEVFLGDEELGSWGVLGMIQPDIVAIGYDQKEMKESLEEYIKSNNLNIEIVEIQSHKPEEFKSSIILDRPCK